MVAPADHNYRTRTALSEHPVMAMTTAFGRRASAAASVGLADGVGTGKAFDANPAKTLCITGCVSLKISEHFYGNEIIILSSVSHPVQESCRRSASPPRMEEGRLPFLPLWLDRSAFATDQERKERGKQQQATPS